MSSLRGWSMARAAGLVLVLGFTANLAGVWMYSVRDNSLVGPPSTAWYFTLERAFIVAAVLLTALGFVLLEGAFQGRNGHVLARIGAAAYFFAGTLIATAELLALDVGYGDVHALGTTYVPVAFLAQASIGGALLRSKMVAAWIGWATLVWSIAWLIVLPVVSPGDIYFPVLHHLPPLVMGIALLRKGS